MFKDTSANYFIVSVPDTWFQCWFEVCYNFLTFRRSFSLKKFNMFRLFKREPVGEHQCEIGYKGHRLSGWEETLRDARWCIIRREFTKGTRPAFHLLEKH
ncbi:MAG: hypothetical protein CBD27_12275 [Rhodospirillaceae bacterium TMED167]|nr:hypothetical protein [Rhodospirillaceae bacterium]OUW23448.1 MAG: hypothetical protein CBD27_12275 [Rhodospirillaceae bacterium TMED167]